MIQKNLSLSFRSKKLIDDTQSHLKDIKEILKVFSYFMFEDQYTLGFVIYHVNLVRERAQYFCLIFCSSRSSSVVLCKE